MKAELLRELGGTAGQVKTYKHTTWNAELVDAFAVAANDPDRSLRDWMVNGCPAGVAKSIPSGGIFPPAEPKGEEGGDLDEVLTATHVAGNYKSVEEEPALAAAEVDRLIAKGYAMHYKDWGEATKKYGKVLVSKLALIVKTREDGSIKARLVLDLRRSKYNSFVSCKERVVLPRLSDLVDDATDLLSRVDGAKGEVVMELVADFVDAFHTLGVHEDEFPYLFAKHPTGGYVGYCTTLCGGAACPLVWGRVGAFLGRTGQALFTADEARVQVFVDDPCTLFRGTPEVCTRRSAVLLWWWCALGLQMSWKKASLGRVVKWIGAEIDLTDVAMVKVSIPRSYGEEVVREARAMLKEKSVEASRLRRFAGKVGWAAGVSPVLWSFVAPLWAAGADADASWRRAGHAAEFHRRGAEPMVGVVKFRHELLWFIALFMLHPGALEKKFHVAARWQRPRLRFYVDASPWGYGAFITYDGEPFEILYGAWTVDDCKKFNLSIGDCAGQAVWEALALLVSMRVWWRCWAGQLTCITAKSDSKAALGALEKERSKSPSINLIAREVALDRAMAEFEPLFDFRHVAGKCNEWADALSRLDQPGSGAVIPGPLRSVTRRAVAERLGSWWRSTAHSLIC